MGEKILLAILGTGNVLMFVQFLIDRHDRKKERAEEKSIGGIKDRLLILEKDGLRTQLLLMILLKPGEQTEILKIAEHYFVKLKANWYMTGIFKKWCDEHGLEPEWFDDKE